MTSNSLYQGFIALILGIMMMLAFAPFSIYPLAITSMAGLCALIYHASRVRSFYLGFLFGLGLFTSGVYWIFISISLYGNVSDTIAYLLTGLLVVYLSLFPGLACYLAAKFFPHNAKAKTLFAFPAFWMITEWIRTWLFTGLPWLMIGYSQTNSPLKGYAPILGVYGVTLAVCLSSSLIIDSFYQYKYKRYFATYISVFAVMSIWVVGALFSLIPWTEATGKPLTLALVQGNIPQSLKWDPENIKLSFNRYTELSEPLWGKADIIIWPEVAIPTPLESITTFINELAQKGIDTNTHIMLGIPIGTQNRNGYYNAIISTGNDNAVYLKRHLVPFGEYVPFRRFLKSAFDIMQVPMSNMVPGGQTQPAMKVGNAHILPSICYEITYPMLMKTRNPAISFILTVTNDAWFGKSTAQAQHLQMAAMRSIEMGRPGVMVSNDGLTAIIDKFGNITSVAPSHIPYVLQGNVQPVHGLTPWMTNGIDPTLAITLVLFFAAYRENTLNTSKSKKEKNK